MAFLFDSFNERSIFPSGSQQQLAVGLLQLKHIRFLLNSPGCLVHLVLTPIAVSHYLFVLVPQHLQLFSVCVERSMKDSSLNKRLRPVIHAHI